VSEVESNEPVPESGGLTKESAKRMTLRARVGMLILTLRAIVLQLLVLGANVLMARVLDPGDFGMFAIVQFVLTLSMLLGDAGLGGALIQQKKEPTQRELSTVFWVQTGLAFAVVAVVWGLSPFARRLWPNLPPESAWLLRTLSLSILFSFLRAIPSILMERHMAFGRLSIIEVLNSLTFYVTVVVLALLHFRAWSLVAGVVAQAAVTFVTTFICRPWKPSFTFDRKALGPMIKFGLPFQVKGIISFFNDAVTPLYAGAMLGQTGLGYVNWGRATAYFPLKLVEVVGRVSFPLYSRLREDPKLLVAEIEKNIKTCLTGTLFFVGLVYAVGPNLTLVVYSDKWMPAVPVLYVFVLAISIGFVSPIIGSAFDAIGEPKIFVRLSIMWTIVNWTSVLVLTPLFPARLRVVGFAVAYSVHVVVGNGAVIWVMRQKLPPTNLWPRARAAILGAIVLAAVGRVGLHPWANGVVTFILAVVASVVLYTTMVALFDSSMRRELRTLFGRDKPPVVEEVVTEV
jgi:O-antigen/teichoic acid export membrane protein